MSKAAEFAELQHLIGDLRRCVTSLRHRYAETPAMRRMVVDTERLIGDLEILEMDADELEHISHTLVSSRDKIQIPDTPYDREFFRDVDDEGVGGHFRR